MLSKAGEIRRDEACLDYAGHDVMLYPCHGSKGNQVSVHYSYANLMREGRILNIKEIITFNDNRINIMGLAS